MSCRVVRFLAMWFGSTRDVDDSGLYFSGLPDLEVSLAPSLNPLPELARAIAQQEQQIEKSRSVHVKELRNAFEQALRSARQRLEQHGTTNTRTSADDVPARRAAAALLEERESKSEALTTSVDIEVVAAKPAFPNVAADLERSLTKPELQRLSASFANATADLHGLAATLVSAFQRELEERRFAERTPAPPSFFNLSATTFASSAGKQDNVRVTASRQSLPTSSSLVEAFAQRLALNDRLDARHFLDLDMQLCKALLRLLRRSVA